MYHRFSTSSLSDNSTEYYVEFIRETVPNPKEGKSIIADDYKQRKLIDVLVESFKQEGFVVDGSNPDREDCHKSQM